MSSLFVVFQLLFPLLFLLKAIGTNIIERTQGRLVTTRPVFSGAQGSHPSQAILDSQTLNMNGQGIFRRDNFRFQCCILRIFTQCHKYKRASYWTIQSFAKKEEGPDKKESSCSDKNSSVRQETQNWFDRKCGSCRNSAGGGC